MTEKHLTYKRASPFVRQHVMRRNGSSLKTHLRPRYPWYEVFRYRDLSGDEAVEIMLHRGRGLNSIEFYDKRSLRKVIEMLQKVEQDWKG